MLQITQVSIHTPPKSKNEISIWIEIDAKGIGEKKRSKKPLSISFGSFLHRILVISQIISFQ